MTEAKSQYFSNLIDENSENPRRLWDTINNILQRTPAAALPESNNVVPMWAFRKIFLWQNQNDPGQFFKSGEWCTICSEAWNKKLFNLEPASDDEVRKIIMKSASKSCDLDPIPTNILKALLDILINP